MTSTVFFILCGVLTVGILIGIAMMSKVKTAVAGNLLSAVCMGAAIVLTLVHYDIFSDIPDLILLCGCMVVSLILGLIWAVRIKMIQMPQIVALFNGFGGAASALVAIVTLLDSGAVSAGNRIFSMLTAALALAIGMITLIGSLVAAGKLSKKLPQKPVIWKAHQLITTVSLLATLALVLIQGLTNWIPLLICIILTLVSGFFGFAFAIRVGGADMPITISLLNSLSGVAGAIAGMAVSDPLLVAVGGIVGASGLLLTQIMCKAMNRSLIDILLGKTSVHAKAGAPKSNSKAAPAAAESPAEKAEEKVDPVDVLLNAKKVIIVPGYGMALAQAQHLVRQLSDKLEANGADVRFAIHPVAGRMPGHMNVLLCEADVPYEKLYEMEAINPEFANTDVAIVIGANDVLNPAARSAEGTPIYGMPVLSVDQAKHVIICNYDLKPGYAGVENPLYSKKTGVSLLLGDAKETLQRLIAGLSGERQKKPSAKTEEKVDPVDVLLNAKKVIIVPGYGMALAQAQHLVKQLADKLEKNGADVRFAIHPVAGRMPGHMNVLLCEADVPYEKLYEMEAINPEFANTDVAIVIGANDVLNPAARSAEGTPIYGMPVLSVDQAKHVIICNYDLKPGYAGVENPLYSKKTGVSLLLGDAKETLQQLIAGLSGERQKKPSEKAEEKVDPAEILKNAKKVIIVPGYGMALAQAQHLVKQLADKLEKNGADVRFAIHPVAGRMPGHMNVLLCEADVPYEKLYEMEAINPEFANTDVAIVIGANDVLNPAARSAEGTPIYGMPVLSVDQAKHVIICNYDLKPGYAGVENPLYSKKTGVTLLLGDAKETLRQLIDRLS